jgi:RNA polymerase sigma factor (sigma-70 family)
MPVPDNNFEPAGQSLDDFARQHGPGLTGFAYLLSGDRPRADDLVQDVLLAMRRRFGDRLKLERPLAYAQRAIVNADTSSSRRQPSSEQQLLGTDPGPGEELWQLLAGLPHRQRVVLVLRHLLGHSDGEIAETLGCRRGTVRSLASRALADLRTSATVSLHSPSDDGANRWVPHDDLERRLTELFQQRAATASQAPRVDLGSENNHRMAAGLRSDRPVRPRKHLALLTAAAVVVIIAGAVVGLQTRRHGERTGTSAAASSLHSVTKPTVTSAPSLAAKPTATLTPPRVTKPTATPTLLLGKRPCKVAAPDSWRQAIAAGAVPVDRGSSEVLTFNSATGDYLVRQGNRLPGPGPPTHEDVKLMLFHGAVGRAIFSGGLLDVPQASMTGAISADWVTFSVADPTNGSRTVMLYERASGKSRALPRSTDPQQALGNPGISEPVIAAGKVYWLSGLAASARLESWDLASGLGGASVPAANAADLISYGSGVVVRHDGRFSQGPGTPLSSDVLAALPQGSIWDLYNFDGISTLSWIREEPFSTSHASVDIGSGRVTYQSRLRLADVPRVLGFPFLGLANGMSKDLLDLRTGSHVDLPAGLGLQAVVGGAAVFGTGGLADWGWAGLSLVPLSALPPTRC